MKKVTLSFLIFQISLLFAGCSAAGNAVSGFVVVAAIIGIPLMLLMFLGNIFSNVKNKGTDSGLNGNLAENLIGLIVIVIFLFGIFKGCSN